MYVGCGGEGESTVPVTGIVCTNITASSNSAGDSAGADNCPLLLLLLLLWTPCVVPIFDGTHRVYWSCGVSSSPSPPLSSQSNPPPVLGMVEECALIAHANCAHYPLQGSPFRTTSPLVCEGFSTSPSHRIVVCVCMSVPL